MVKPADLRFKALDVLTSLLAHSDPDVRCAAAAAILENTTEGEPEGRIGFPSSVVTVREANRI